MRILSIQVGRPREVEGRGGKTVKTGIFKAPVEGPVRVARTNLEGDEQADLSVHGGAEKAVYAYPSEHYAYWRSEFPDVEISWGMFGENLTTDGLDEKDLSIGDRLRIGTAEFQVTQPRVPCFKLGIRFGRPEVVKRFLRSGRSGFYLSVLQEGAISPGDEIVPIPAEGPSLSVSEISRLSLAGDSEQTLLRQASELEALPAEWRETFRNRLSNSGARTDL